MIPSNYDNINGSLEEQEIIANIYTLILATRDQLMKTAPSYGNHSPDGNTLSLVEILTVKHKY